MRNSRGHGPGHPKQAAPVTIRKVRGLIVIYDDFFAPVGSRREALIQKHFGERVRELRKQKGLSQEALALACDLDRTYIGGVERGERNISLVNIHKIAEALGMKAKELFNG
jgi:DNA-binding XRE family transcriptional regulator